MGMSAAERMRRYRQSMKSDQQGYKEYLDNEKRRYKRRKQNGDIKLIDDCTDREKNLTRRKWRKEQREKETGRNQKSMKE